MKKKTTQVVIKESLTAVEKSKAKEIEKTFTPMVAMLKEFESEVEKVVNAGNTPENAKAAKKLRLKIAKIRIEADKVRKAQKAEYLRAGNAIQAVYNILKYAVVDKEETLKEIEDYQKKIEEQRIKDLDFKRRAMLPEGMVPPAEGFLASMEESVWEVYLDGLHAQRQKEWLEAVAREKEEERLKEEEIEKRAQEIASQKVELTPTPMIDKPVAPMTSDSAEFRDAEMLEGWAVALDKKIKDLKSTAGRASVIRAIAILQQGAVAVRRGM